MDSFIISLSTAPAEIALLNKIADYDFSRLENLTIMEAINDLSSYMPATIMTKVNLMTDKPAAAINHLYSLCLSAKVSIYNQEFRLIDVDGTTTGKLFAPADIVLMKDNEVFLIDYTSDMSLASNKKRALDDTISKIASSCKLLVFHSEIKKVMICPASATLRTTLPLYTVTNKIHQFQVDLIKALDNNKVDANRFFNQLTANLPERLAPSIESYDVKTLADIAAGDVNCTSFDYLMKNAQARYPKTCAKITETLFTECKSFSRGMPPPKMSTDTKKDPLLIEFLIAAVSLEEGMSIALFNDDYEITENALKPGLISGENLPIVQLRAIGNKCFKISVSESAPSNWLDLTGRAKESNNAKRSISSTTDTTNEDAYNNYLELEDTSRIFEKKCNTDMPSLVDRAALLLNTFNKSETSDVKIASGVAANTLRTFNGTVAGKMLAVARIIAEHAALSAVSNGMNVVRISSTINNDIITIAKHSGSLANMTATSLITVIRNPVKIETSWVYEMTDEIAVSKCLMFRTDYIDWLSRAPGNAYMIYNSIINSTKAIISDHLDVAAMTALMAVSSRKPFAVTMKLERYYVLSSTSVFSSMDDHIDKIESTCLIGIEKLLLSRMLIRSLAAALIRDTGDMSSLIQEASDKHYSINVAGIYSRNKIMSAQGIANMFYDYNITSGISSSHLKSSAIAFTKATELSAVWNSWAKKSNDLAYGASAATYNAWKWNQLSDWVTTPDFEAEEVDYAIKLATEKKKGTVSILALYLAAKISADTVDMNDVMVTVNSTDDKSIYTTRKALDEKQTPIYDIAAALNMRNTCNQATNSSVDDISSATFLTTFLSDSATLASTSTTSMMRSRSKTPIFKLSVLEKVDSIEKARDISLMSETWRPIIKFVEDVGKEIGLKHPNSALHNQSKLRTMMDMANDAVRAKEGEVLVRIASDVSSYGPSKLPYGFFATISGLTTNSELRSVYQDFATGLANKQMYATKAVVDASRDELAIVCPDIVDILYTNESQKPFISLPVGMMQGLAQNMADSQSAIATKVIEHELSKVGYCKFVTTNDDGSGVVIVPITEMRSKAYKIASIIEGYGYIFNEAKNMAKLIMSSFISELNTKLMINMEPCMPWVRSLMSCASIDAGSSISDGAISVMQSTNTAVAEGAPLSALYAALAIGWASHYERYHVVDMITDHTYINDNPLFLGKPIFRPMEAAVYGIPAVLALRMIESDNQLEVQEAADFVLSDLLTTSMSTVTFENWNVVVDEIAEVDGNVRDYVLYSLPVKPLTRDTRFSQYNFPIDRATWVLKISSASVGSSIHYANAAICDSVIDSPFKTTSTIMAKTSMVFAKSSNRVVQRSMVYTSSGISSVSTPMSWEQFMINIKSNQRNNTDIVHAAIGNLIDIDKLRATLTANICAAVTTIKYIDESFMTSAYYTLSKRSCKVIKLSNTSSTIPIGALAGMVHDITKPIEVRNNCAIIAALDASSSTINDWPDEITEAVDIRPTVKFLDSIAKFIVRSTMGSSQEFIVNRDANASEASLVQTLRSTAIVRNVTIAPKFAADESDYRHPSTLFDVTDEDESFAKQVAIINTKLSLEIYDVGYERSNCVIPSLYRDMNNNIKLNMIPRKILNSYMSKLVMRRESIVMSESNMEHLSNSKGSDILRRYVRGVSIGRVSTLTVVSRGYKIPYLAVRIKTWNNGEYSYVYHVFTRKEVDRIETGRGKHVVINDGQGRLGDAMVLCELVGDWSNCEMSLNCAPATIGITISNIYIPIMDAVPDTVPSITLSESVMPETPPMMSLPASTLNSICLPIALAMASKRGIIDAILVASCCVGLTDSILFAVSNLVLRIIEERVVIDNLPSNKVTSLKRMKANASVLQAVINCTAMHLSMQLRSTNAEATGTFLFSVIDGETINRAISNAYKEREVTQPIAMQSQAAATEDMPPMTEAEMLLFMDELDDMVCDEEEVECDDNLEDMLMQYGIEAAPRSAEEEDNMPRSRVIRTSRYSNVTFTTNLRINVGIQAHLIAIAALPAEFGMMYVDPKIRVKFAYGDNAKLLTNVLSSCTCIIGALESSRAFWYPGVKWQDILIKVDKRDRYMLMEAETDEVLFYDSKVYNLAQAKTCITNFLATTRNVEDLIAAI